MYLTLQLHYNKLPTSLIIYCNSQCEECHVNVMEIRHDNNKVNAYGLYFWIISPKSCSTNKFLQIIVQIVETQIDSFYFWIISPNCSTNKFLQI